MRLMLGLVSLLLVSCASVAPAPQRVLPPLELLQPCTEPPILARSNGELVQTLRNYIDALRGCNADKEALRRWAE